MVFAPRKQPHNCITNETIVVNQTVTRVNKITYLGVMLDTHLKDHINSKCVKATSNVVRIRSVRKYLTEDAAKTLMSGLVLSHLDYANVLLTGLT